MKVDEFTGGLNTKIDPSLLPSNSAVTLVNADIASGVLKAMSNVSDDAKYSGVLNQFIQHKGNIISSAEAAVGYTEYANDLYYTEGGVLKQLRSATEYTVGLAKPASALILGEFNAPEAPTDTITTDAPALTFFNLQLTTGDFPLLSALDYKIIHKNDLGEVIRVADYSTALTGSNDGIRVTAYGPLGFSADLYRYYSGNYRLVGSVSTAPGLFVSNILDEVYDISANPITTVVELKPNLTAADADYYYELRTVDSSSGTDLYSEPLDITVSSPPLIAFDSAYAKIDLADPTDLILLRVHTDSITGVVIYYEVPYVVDSAAYIDYLLDPSDPAGVAYTVIDITARLSGTYQYVSTFYNSVNGYESQPSALSAELIVVGGIINVTNILSNSAATHIRIYRVGGALTQFTRVTEVVNGTATYTDNESDTAIDGTLLVSDDYNVPSNNMTLLAESNGVLFGAIGSKLVFSKQGLVFAWPLENFIEFKNEITCIQEAANGVIVCTETETFVITGNSPKSFSKYPVSGEHGCLFNTSFQKLRNGVIFKSATALVFTSGGEVTVLTEKFFNPLDISVLGSAVHNNTYYAMSATDIFVYNLTDGNYYTIGLAASNLGIVDNKVHALIGTELHSLGEGSTLATLQYKSPLFTDGNHSELKSYKNVYFAVKGTFTLKIYLDEVLEVTREVVTTKIEAIDVKVPQLKQKAVNIQIEISGTGTVYEYEWKSLGRQNGR